MNDNVTVFDYLRVLWRYGWLLVTLFVVAVTAMAVITIRTPKVYEATATLLIPKEGGSPFSRLAGLGLVERSLASSSPRSHRIVTFSSAS